MIRDSRLSVVISSLTLCALAACAQSQGPAPQTAPAPPAVVEPEPADPLANDPIFNRPTYEKSKHIYKTVAGKDLHAYVFSPLPPKEGSRPPVPAMVFYFGGGWRQGSPLQFVPHARYLAERGMVAVLVDYRVRSRDGVDIADCVADAKSAMRWVRSHAEQLGVDPDRIASAGGSAGGHLAASVTTLNGLDHADDDLSVSSASNAMVLFNPVLDLSRDARFAKRDWDAFRERMGAEPIALSPTHNVKAGLPPTLIFHGTGDTTVPHDQPVAFCEAMRASQNDCKLLSYVDQPHGFFNFSKPGAVNYFGTLRHMDHFLTELGYLAKRPATLSAGGKVTGKDYDTWYKAPAGFRFPKGRKIAVSLTYDDGIPNHTELVGPVLKRHGVKATFYVTVNNDPVRVSPAPWRKLAKQGHELGSHSLFHPCRKKPHYTWLPDHYDLRKYTPGRFHGELAVTNGYLELLDGKKARSYGNNCVNLTIGEGAGEVSMIPTLQKLYVAARGPESKTSVVPENGFNIMELGHYTGDQRTFKSLKAEIEGQGTGDQAVWLIYMIHGVGEGSHASFIETAEHEKLISWLARNKREIWTAPLVDVAQFVKEKSAPFKPQ